MKKVYNVLVMLVNSIVISVLGYMLVDIYLKIQIEKLSLLNTSLTYAYLLILLVLEQALVNYIINKKVIAFIKQRDTKGNEGGISIDKVLKSMQKIKENNPDSIVQDIIIDSKNNKILYRLK